MSIKRDTETRVGDTTIPVLYYDQKSDACVNLYDASNKEIETRQFEWESCGYSGNKVEHNIIEAQLNENYLPTAVGGELLSNRGVNGNNFNRWFHAVDGKSKSYTGAIVLKYNSEVTSFEFESDNYYPLDSHNTWGENFNNDGHNHLFTMNLGIPFLVAKNGKEEFRIVADDDTWVFLNNDLVIDMGGIHNATTGTFKIVRNGEVWAGLDNNHSYTGVNLTNIDSAIVRVFHADRNSENSVFGMKLSNMLLNVSESSLTQTDGEIMVAYDPENPSEVAPLGESLSISPIHSETMATIVASTQAVAFGSLMVLLAVAISLVWRCSHRVRKRVK